MSERGRGSGSGAMDEDPGDDDAVGTPAPADYPVPPTAARPIAPYDPYRPASGDLPRVSRRNVAAETFEPPRSSTRTGDPGPFLPDDDPLNADAWQLELDEIAEPDGEFAPRSDAPRETPPPPHRERRPPGAAQAQREERAAPRRAPRRTRTAAAAPRERPAVTFAVPRVVSGSSLASDETMLALLGINLASVLIMTLVLGVRLGSLPTTIVLQLDAAGNPALWGPPSVLWRLPLMAFSLTACFLVVSWFLHPIDRFAARFALASAVVAQVIAWIALVKHLA